MNRILGCTLTLGVLTLTSAYTAEPPAKTTFPQQAWAHTSGLVTMLPHGAAASGATALDRLLIQEAFSRWGMAYDEARLEVVASLFTEDATFEVMEGSNRPLVKKVGRDEIVKSVAAALRQQGDQRRHCITNVLVERLVDGKASALAYGIVTVAADGLSLGATVIYTADLQREADGTWRFSRFVIGMDTYAGRKPNGQ